MTSNSIHNSRNEFQLLINNIEKGSQDVKPNSEENVRVRNDLEKAQLDRYKNDTILKKILTIFVICFTSIWSIGILIFLFLLGFQEIECSDAIIIALLTETLVTVLGLPLVVTSHFFPKQ